MDARVDEVAQNEIDDPVFASEGNGRFGPFLGEREEPGAFAAGEYDAQHADVHSFSKALFFQGAPWKWQVFFG